MQDTLCGIPFTKKVIDGEQCFVLKAEDVYKNTNFVFKNSDNFDWNTLQLLRKDSKY